MNDEKATDVVDSKPDDRAPAEKPGDNEVLKPEDPKTDNEDSLTEELGDVTIESISSIDEIADEPELDLRLRLPEEELRCDDSRTEGASGIPASTDIVPETLTDVAGLCVDNVIARSVAHVVSSV